MLRTGKETASECTIILVNEHDDNFGFKATQEPFWSACTELFLCIGFFVN